jgi:hypothetical protein
MGRQIQLSMLPTDRDALLREIRNQSQVEIVVLDGDSVDVQPHLLLSDTSRATLTLWNTQLPPTLQRKQTNSAAPSYHRVDGSVLPVLEFSTSVLTEWQGRPALTQGRIYAAVAGQPIGFETWFEKIVNYVRKHWSRTPVPLLGGYSGPAANDWFAKGGLLLPMFAPPPTDEWIRVMSQQHPPNR